MSDLSKVYVFSKSVKTISYREPVIVRVLTNAAVGGSSSQTYPPYYRNLVNADLTNNKVIIYHALNTETPSITVFNNQKYEVFPSDFKAIDLMSAELDLMGYTPLVNIWRVKIVRE